MASMILIGAVAVAGTAFAARVGLKALQRYQAMPKGAVAAAAQKHYVGGFEPTMTKAEAALILGIRRSASIKKIKEKHRKLMVANHPDAGGSPLIATKVNQAKELLLKDMEGSSSASDKM